MPAGSLQSPEMAMAPVAVSPQAAARPTRRRRRRKAQPPSTMVAIPPPQVMPQGPDTPGAGQAPPIPAQPMTEQTIPQAPALAPPITEDSPR